MKTVSLKYKADHKAADVYLPASKSIANRVLIIRALCSDHFSIDNLSTAKDTEVLNALLDHPPKDSTWNVGLAGTAYRFLTAYLSVTDGSFELTGEHRMKERPIGLLVEALQHLGAEIEYQEKEGYPPLKINGNLSKGGEVAIPGNVSSQYLSALALIAPLLDGGLTIRLTSELVSRPYLKMTLALLKHFGVDSKLEEDSVYITEGKYLATDFKVESDWSAASYWYSLLAIQKQGTVFLAGLDEMSLQGDSALITIYKYFGVKTEFTKDGVQLSYVGIVDIPSEIDLVETPDLAQTIAVTSAALNQQVALTGLKTLRIKETDRLEALKVELEKCGASVRIQGDDALEVISGVDSDQLANVSIDTYNDHRMAMAFAPLAVLGKLQINDPDVVVKSYPEFWQEWEKYFELGWN